jgi:Uma2 family endonuclease
VLEDLLRGKKFSDPFVREDLDRVSDDGRRYEIIDGGLIVTPSPAWAHQRAVLELAVVLHAACPAELEVLLAPFIVDDATNTVVLPDLAVARRDKLTDRDLLGPPELAVEVVTWRTRGIDVDTKREVFERSGARAFWTVDPTPESGEVRLIAWELGDDGRYQEIANVSGESEFHAKLPYSVTVVPGTLVR